MNKKAFTLIELLATIVVIAIIMGIVLPAAMKVRDDNKEKIYEEYLSMMEEYALVNEKRGSARIELSELEELGKVKHDCESGYVIRISTNPLKYKAYLQCGSYTTTGYNS